MKQNLCFILMIFTSFLYAKDFNNNINGIIIHEEYDQLLAKSSQNEITFEIKTNNLTIKNNLYSIKQVQFIMKKFINSYQPVEIIQNKTIPKEDTFLYQVKLKCRDKKRSQEIPIEFLLYFLKDKQENKLLKFLIRQCD